LTRETLLVLRKRLLGASSLPGSEMIHCKFVLPWHSGTSGFSRCNRERLRACLRLCVLRIGSQKASLSPFSERARLRAAGCSAWKQRESNPPLGASGESDPTRSSTVSIRLPSTALLVQGGGRGVRHLAQVHLPGWQPLPSPRELQPGPRHALPSGDHTLHRHGGG
jgi:hypothetical protein